MTHVALGKHTAAEEAIRRRLTRFYSQTAEANDDRLRNVNDIDRLRDEIRVIQAALLLRGDNGR